MPIESNPLYIPDLNADYPNSNDQVDQGDDHIRNIKNVLKTTFPDANKEMLLRNYEFPVGMITMFTGDINTIPEGWKLCNGEGTISNGLNVPDLQHKFILGAGTVATETINIGDTGGTKEHAAAAIPQAQHTHTAEFCGTELDTHSHTSVGGSIGRGTETGGQFYNEWEQGGNHTTNGSSAGTPAGTITIATSPVEPDTRMLDNQPPWYALAFIVKD